MFIAHLRDGRTIKEVEGVDWKDIPLQDITSLQLVHKGSGVTHTLSVDGSNVKLLQLKRNTLNTVEGTDKITERVIGFILGEMAVKLEVDEKSGNTRLTISKKENKGYKKL